MKKIITFLLAILSVSLFAQAPQTPEQITAQILKGMAEKNFGIMYSHLTKDAQALFYAQVKSRIQSITPQNAEHEKAIKFYLSLAPEEFMRQSGKLLPDAISEAYRGAKILESKTEQGTAYTIFQVGNRKQRMDFVLIGKYWKMTFGGAK